MATMRRHVSVFCYAATPAHIADASKIVRRPILQSAINVNWMQRACVSRALGLLISLAQLLHAEQCFMIIALHPGHTPASATTHLKCVAQACRAADDDC